MADIVAAAPQHAVTVIRTAEKKLLLNPNLLTPTTFDRLLVSVSRSYPSYTPMVLD